MNPLEAILTDDLDAEDDRDREKRDALIDAIGALKAIVKAHKEGEYHFSPPRCPEPVYFGKAFILARKALGKEEEG